MNIFAAFLSGMFVLMAITWDAPVIYSAAVVAGISAIGMTIENVGKEIVEELRQSR